MIDYANQEERYVYIRSTSGVTVRVGPDGDGWYAEVSSVKGDYLTCFKFDERDEAADMAVCFYLQKVLGETPWAVYCYEGHGKVCLTKEQYNRQMNRANHRWHCPMGGCSAGWDDEHHELHLYGTLIEEG